MVGRPSSPRRRRCRVECQRGIGEWNWSCTNRGTNEEQCDPYYTVESLDSLSPRNEDSSDKVTRMKKSTNSRRGSDEKERTLTRQTLSKPAISRHTLRYPAGRNRDPRRGLRLCPCLFLELHQAPPRSSTVHLRQSSGLDSPWTVFGYAALASGWDLLLSRYLV